MRILCWNIGHRKKAWRQLAKMDIDIALIQEGYAPPSDVSDKLEVDPAPYKRPDGSAITRCAVVKLSDRVDVEFLPDIQSSHPGCLSAAVVTPREGPFTNYPIHLVSFCPEYETYHPSSGLKSNRLVDTSVHRIISDISLLIGRKNTFRMIAAGDTTVMYGDGTNEYWRKRNMMVFDRFEAVGLQKIGPDGPTFYYPGQKIEEAYRQLDYVFASKTMNKYTRVEALNQPDKWGPSDHCRILIEVSSTI